MSLPLPQYLARPVDGATTYGCLRRTGDGDRQFWLIEGEPQVAVMAKRLFPGAEGRGAGVAKFSANRRTFGDLVWLLHRWPLRIEDPVVFDAAYREAVEYALQRQAANSEPVLAQPDVVFKGTLRPFQQEGLNWMLTNRRTLIADEMGLGKTVQGIAFLATEQAWPALVVAPPHLILHWRSKLDEFLQVAGDSAGPLFAEQDGLKVCLLHCTPRKMKGPLPKAHIYIVHYLLLKAWRSELREMGVRRILFDEIQDLRHTNTEKYAAASELAALAEDVIGFSGTPIYNRGHEIWSITNILEYQCLGDRESFAREWCWHDGEKSETVKDTELLHAHLRREGLMLRRRKSEVLKDLPPKRRIVQLVESDDSMFNELVAKAVELAKGATSLPDALARGRSELEAINETRMATGIAKAAASAAFVRSLLEAEQPTIVFAHHHAVQDMLLDLLKDFNPVCITGRQTKEEKWQAVQDFKSGKTSLVIIGLRSATGIDGLQGRVKAVVFAELDWSPAVHSQAEDRGHRDGLMDSLLCYYLVSENGTDPEMQEALGIKVSQFVGLMGDVPESEEDRVLAAEASGQYMRKVLEKLRARAA
ncbi:DEAD/DEAH box helicase [Pseudomonas aeruginosa]|uniref:SNF2-related protein n=1 Tax=Pseudomonas aeruginosa TaxID=287 RepID=UPI00226D6E0A|nr:DEAD/DEAH box helicase [Pseudomonas aeruginosa]MCY0290188.1 DEAD/DEAH box helicase [Pseudomonas aeruginosa]MCY0401369.1 DEAD/DEAH box helicase [Pseudomonas aeruginosa]